MRHYYALFILIICSILGFNACKNNELVLATSANFAPFEYVNNGEIRGIDIEIAQIIAKKLNKKLVIKDMPFDSVLSAVASGKADLAISGLTSSASRAMVVGFSQTYFNAAQKMLVNANDERFSNITSKKELLSLVESIPNIKIGVQSGTTSEAYAKGDSSFGFKGFSNAIVQGFIDANVATNALNSNQIDIVIVDEIPAMEIVKAHSGVRLIDIPLTSEAYAIAVALYNQELRDVIDSILADMKDDGRLESIIKSYQSAFSKLHQSLS